MTAMAQGDAYPKGGYRPRDAVQRGSVQDLTLYSGDPLTPGVGATAGAKRLAIKDAKTISENSGAADFLCGRRAAAGSARGAAWRRPAGAAACRSPTTSAPDRRSVHLKVAVRLEPEDRSTMSLRRSAAARSRTGGSSAATITTAGCSAPRIRSRDRWRSWPRRRRSANW